MFLVYWMFSYVQICIWSLVELSVEDLFVICRSNSVKLAEELLLICRFSKKLSYFEFIRRNVFASSKCRIYHNIWYSMLDVQWWVCRWCRVCESTEFCSLPSNALKNWFPVYASRRRTRRSCAWLLQRRVSSVTCSATVQMSVWRELLSS